jgi:high-affinity nickel-transport protein
MLDAYDWAFVKPLRKLYYNMTITLESVIVALLIGGIEALGLVADRFELAGGLWNAIGAPNGNLKDLGFAVVGVFVAAWVLSYLIYRIKNLDQLEVRGADSASSQ